MTAPAAPPAAHDAAEKHHRLLERLLAKTRSGRLRWRAGIDSTTFSLELSPGMLYVSRDLFEEGDRVGVHYQLDICDEEGFPAETVAADFDRHREAGPLVDLYEAARGQARGADRLVDGLLETLDAN